jgi:hypothetical protein
MLLASSNPSLSLSADSVIHGRQAFVPLSVWINSGLPRLCLPRDFSPKHGLQLDRNTADYVLATFPIVPREEVDHWGRFRSRDFVLAYMAALEAGKPDADVAE